MAQHFIGIPIGNAGVAGPVTTRPLSGYITKATVEEVIADFASRLREVQWHQKGTVKSNEILSQIALSNEAILISSNKIAIAGEVTFLDWIRDVNGVNTGVVDPSYTRIRGGVIQTGKIMSRDTESYIDLDATGATTFIKGRDSVAIKADGTFIFGDTSTGKALRWDGSELTIQSAAKLAGTPVGTVVGQAAAALNAEIMRAGTIKIVSQTNGVDGNQYKLDTNSTAGAVLIGHVDAVFGAGSGAGYSAINNVYRSMIAITSGGIAMGYNRPSDGMWIDAVSISAQGNAYFKGEVRTGSVISDAVTVGGVSLGTISSQAQLGATRPVGDVTSDILSNSATAITMTSSNLFKSSNGAGGVFIGAGGIIGKNHSGTTTFAIDGTSGYVYFAGDITGGSNIDITGQAIFRGVSNAGGGIIGTVVALGNGLNNGIVATNSGSGNGLLASNSGTGVGVWGHSSYGNGVYGTSSGSYAIYGVASGSGASSIGVYGEGNAAGVLGRSPSVNSPGIHCIGPMKWGSTQWNPPTSSGLFLKDDGTWASAGSAFTPVQQGGGSGQLTNKIYIGWNGSNLALQVDSTSFGSNWPISISGTSASASYATSAGSANYATSAGSATSAGTASNADRLGGYTASDITAAVNAAFVAKNVGYTLTIPGLGSWSGCTLS